MRNAIYLILLLLVASCNPIYNPNKPSRPSAADSVFVCADFRKHGDYYNTGHQVYAIDLLSQGLEYDSLFHIQGSGYNLFLSDIFTTSTSLPAGHYQMDSVAKDMTFLRGMDFEGSITGTYLLQISENKIQRIAQSVRYFFSIYQQHKTYLNSKSSPKYFVLTSTSAANSSGVPCLKTVPSINKYALLVIERVS